jgi:hypothetical protein
MIAVVDVKVKQKMVAIILHASATTLNLMPRSYIHEETPVVAPVMREEEGPALTTTVPPLTIFYDGKRGRRDARRGAKGARSATSIVIDVDCSESISPNKSITHLRRTILSERDCQSI